MKEIKNQIYRFKENNIQIAIPYSLHIEGGEGHGKHTYGGTYHFVGTYLNPTELLERGNYSLEKMCESNQIPYVTGKTFEELVEKLKTFDRTDKPKTF